MARRKPIIGIPVNLLVDPNSTIPGMERMFVNQEYIRAIQLAGGVPVCLPYAVSAEDLESQLDLLDGLLFAGGADLSPLAYGEEPKPGLGEVVTEMDAHQLALAKAGLERDIPMLGVCRGMQVMNVAAGGTLYQDLGREVAAALQHVQKSGRHAASHTVRLEAGSQLHQLFGQAEIRVNTFHHQAVKAVAPGFRVTGRACDDVIEGFERSEGGFALAVQWHPEGMVDSDPDMRRVFEALIAACAQQRMTAA